MQWQEREPVHGGDSLGMLWHSCFTGSRAMDVQRGAGQCSRRFMARRELWLSDMQREHTSHRDTEFERLRLPRLAVFLPCWEHVPCLHSIRAAGRQGSLRNNVPRPTASCC